MSAAESPPPLPESFAAALPKKCKQVLYTVARSQKTTSAQLWMLERVPRKGWQPVQAAIPVKIGRKGMAWGTGLHPSRLPSGWRRKKEGDGCTPAGVFKLPAVFGATQKQRIVRMPYIRCTSHMMGIDDPKSRYYNQIVDFRDVQMDWGDAELMSDYRGHYNWGIVVGHNPNNIPGAGSCIFVHIWLGQDVPTAGCTAMSERDIERVITWLAPEKDPHIVQAVVKR